MVPTFITKAQELSVFFHQISVKLYIHIKTKMLLLDIVTVVFVFLWDTIVTAFLLFWASIVIIVFFPETRLVCFVVILGFISYASVLRFKSLARRTKNMRQALVYLDEITSDHTRVMCSSQVKINIKLLVKDVHDFRA